MQKLIYSWEAALDCGREAVPAARARYDRSVRRDRPLAALYTSARWRQARAAHLAAHPVCVQCERCGLVKADELEVDHIVPHRGDEALFWDAANWQTLCRTHHGEKTRADERSALGLTAAVLVLGPPGGGKSAFVRSAMARGDVRLDVDALIHALTGLPLRDKPEAVVAVALAARDGVLRALKAPSRVRRLWIETAAPTRAERARLVSGLHVERTVCCVPDLATCLARIAGDPSRVASRRRDEALARDWYARYEPPLSAARAEGPAPKQGGGGEMFGKRPPAQPFGGPAKR